MALIGNYSVLNKTPGRELGGVGHSNMRGQFGKSGALRNAAMLEDGCDETRGLPNGYGTTGWMWPLKQGQMSSNLSARITFGSTANAIMGFPIVGATSFSITIADADGQLISSGNGTATITITSNTPLLTASLNAAGSATITLTANTPTLGAEASLNGASTLTVTGELTPHAAGWMIGSTVDGTVLTADIVASAVWSALASQFNDVGTMGSKLNTASSGGVDLNALADAVVAALQLTILDANIVKVNNVSVDGTGTSGDPWGPA